MAEPAPQPEKQTPSKPAVPVVPRVAQRPAALVAFLILTAAILGGDLWLKAWSFRHIADHPVQLQSSPDGPIVLIQPEGEGVGPWLPTTEVYDRIPAGMIPPHEPTVAVPKLLNFQLTLNTGAVFGLGKGARWLFIVVSVIATCVILVMVWRSPAKAYVYHTALAMILAGALGNLYDRVRFSAVRDMLHMLPDTPLWPWIFNLADVALVLGVGLILVISFLSERRQRNAESAAG